MSKGFLIALQRRPATGSGSRLHLIVDAGVVLSREMLHSVLLLLVAAGTAAKEIVMTFPDRGPGYPKGTITLSQASAFDDLIITTALSNMENSAEGNVWQGGRKQTTTTPIIEHRRTLM